MRFRRSQDDVTADVGVSAPHVDPPSDQIDVTNAQGSCLAPAKARVGEEEHKHPPRAGCERQVVDLLMSQKDVIAALGAGELEPSGRVDTNAPTADGVIEDGRRDEYCLPDARRPEAGRCEPGNPLRQIFKRDLGQWDVTPGGQDMEREQGVVPVPGLGLKVSPVIQSGIRVLPEGDAAQGRVGPVTLCHQRQS
jgi:hypothetical protein